MTAWSMSVKVPTEDYLETDIRERIEKTVEVQPDTEVVDFATGTAVGAWSDGMSDIDVWLETEDEATPWVVEVALITGQPVTIMGSELVGVGLSGDELAFGDGEGDMVDDESSTGMLGSLRDKIAG